MNSAWIRVSNVPKCVNSWIREFTREFVNFTGNSRVIHDSRFSFSFELQIENENRFTTVSFRVDCRRERPIHGPGPHFWSNQSRIRSQYPQTVEIIAHQSCVRHIFLQRQSTHGNSMVAYRWDPYWTSMQFLMKSLMIPLALGSTQVTQWNLKEFNLHLHEIIDHSKWSCINHLSESTRTPEGNLWTY